MKRKIIWIFGILIIVAGIAWMNRIDILLQIPRVKAYFKEPIGPHKEVVWDKGPRTSSESPSQRKSNIIVILAIAPVVGWASPWSHHHMAYAAGLGSFGMHDFFITEKGCAHRAASFVVNLKLEPNREKQKDIHANCLHYQGIQCLKCAQRCPVDAITAENAHDKERCMKRVKAPWCYCCMDFRNWNRT